MALVVKNPLANAGDIRDTGSIPGLERSSGGGNGNPLQYSWLENPVDRGTWWAAVHRVAKSRTWLKWLSSSSSMIHYINWLPNSEPSLHPWYKLHFVTVHTSFCMIAQLLSHVWLFMSPWTVAHQVPLSTGFSRQEHWSGLPFPSPGDFPDSGIKPASPALAGGFFTTEPPWKPPYASFPCC